MNVLFIIPNLGVGGAQSFLLRMLSAFPREHKIYLYDVHPKQREKEILSNLSVNIKIYSSKYERIELFLLKYPKIFTKILNRTNRYFSLKSIIDRKYFNKIIKKNKIDLINSHMYLADSFVYENCKFNIPLVSSFHGCYNLIWEKMKGTDNFEKLRSSIQGILNRYSGIIIAAEKHKTVFINYQINSNKHVEKIYYGFPSKPISDLNLREEYKIPHDNFIFGMVARGEINNSPAVIRFFIF